VDGSGGSEKFTLIVVLEEFDSRLMKRIADRDESQSERGRSVELELDLDLDLVGGGDGTPVEELGGMVAHQEFGKLD
jgi:hypothetical protein